MGWRSFHPVAGRLTHGSTSRIESDLSRRKDRAEIMHLLARAGVVGLIEGDLFGWERRLHELDK